MGRTNPAIETTECLIDSEWIKYDFSDEDRDAFSEIKDKQYIGQSSFHRVGGIVQSGVALLHHWKR